MKGFERDRRKSMEKRGNEGKQKMKNNTKHMEKRIVQKGKKRRKIEEKVEK